MTSFIQEYNDKINSGEITVGKWIKKVFNYITEGLNDESFYFDETKANEAVEWIEENCFHTEGPLAPDSLKLELWQKAIISAMFGLVGKDGYRQFREVVLIVGRKNGKSLLASAIARYVWLVQGGYGARVYCIAPKLDQTDIIYNSIWQMTTIDPKWRQLKAELQDKRESSRVGVQNENLAKRRQSDLILEAKNSTVKKIAFSAKKSDGFNPSLAICDEIASWVGDNGLKQYEVMKSGMGARPEGLMLSCTTAGYENDGIFDEIIKRSTAVLNGTSEEKRLLPFLYIIDNEAKWDDLEELKKSNPNLGVSVSSNYLEEEVSIAHGSLSKTSEFKTKYCNIKQNSSTAWLNTSDVKKCIGKPLKLNDFKNTYAVGGLDLSQTTDLTFAICIIERDGILNVFGQAFMPSEKIEEATARDGVPYSQYVKTGELMLSGDNFVDYHDCFNWFTNLVEEYKIYPLMIGYDRYSAQYLVQDLNAYGFRTDDVYQGYNLSPVIREAEGLIKDGKINIGDNNLLKMHLLDTALKSDNENNKIKIIKVANNVHIDGVAALLDALTVRQKWYDELGERLKNE